MALSQAQHDVTAKPASSRRWSCWRLALQAPDQQAEERRRAKRMAPEGDQRLHYTRAVNSTDMRRVSLNFTNK